MLEKADKTRECGSFKRMRLLTLDWGKLHVCVSDQGQDGKHCLDYARCVYECDIVGVVGRHCLD